MGLRYPNTFRVKVLKEVHAEDMSILKIAQAYKVSRETIYKWLRDEKNDTLFEDNRKNAGRPLSTDPEPIIQYVREYPDAFQHEVAERFETSQGSVWRALKAYGFKRKKRESI